MANSLTIDASVLLSSLIADEVHHELSRKALEKIREENITVVLSTWTVFEVLHAHYRRVRDVKLTDQIYRGFIEWNLERRLKILEIEGEFLIYFSSHHPRFDLKTADTVVALTAHRLKSPLLTWDRQLIKAARPQVKAMTPREFLEGRLPAR